MLKKRLIPSLLLLDGRCVKGRQFADFRDTGNPLTAARVYDAQGADELIFLDINASAEGRNTTLEVVHRVAEECFMPLCVGGGVQSVDDFRTLLRNGADKVSVNTAAVEQPAILTEAAERFGNQCVVLSIDVRGTAESGWEVYTHAGSRPTGLHPVEWAVRATEAGAGEILITSIEREGTMEGYDLDLVRAVAGAVDVPVIAHGGCGTLHHLVEAIEVGADAASCASMLHFTDQSVIKARAHMKTYGVDVRIA